MAPITSQTSKSHIGEPSALAIRAGVRKMPTAMMPPITADVVEASPARVANLEWEQEWWGSP